MEIDQSQEILICGFANGVLSKYKLDNFRNPQESIQLQAGIKDIRLINKSSMIILTNDASENMVSVEID